MDSKALHFVSQLSEGLVVDQVAMVVGSKVLRFVSQPSGHPAIDQVVRVVDLMLQHCVVALE